jgi:hypothetical protein
MLTVLLPVMYVRGIEICVADQQVHTGKLRFWYSIYKLNVSIAIANIFMVRTPWNLYTHVSMGACLCRFIVFRKWSTYSAVLVVSMCLTHACVNIISVYWMYEMPAGRSDGTGLPKHATLYVTYNTIGCTACLYETFPCWNNHSYRNGS